MGNTRFTLHQVFLERQGFLKDTHIDARFLRTLGHLYTPPRFFSVACRDFFSVIVFIMPHRHRSSHSRRRHSRRASSGSHHLVTKSVDAILEVPTSVVKTATPMVTNSVSAVFDTMSSGINQGAKSISDVFSTGSSHARSSHRRSRSHSRSFAGGARRRRARTARRSRARTGGRRRAGSSRRRSRTHRK